MFPEKVMAPPSSTLAWKIPWTEEAGGRQSMGSQRVGHDWATLLSLFTFHFHALKKETATHSSVLAWRIPGTGEPGGLPSMGWHRVRHNWRDWAAAAATCKWLLESQSSDSPWQTVAIMGICFFIPLWEKLRSFLQIVLYGCSQLWICVEKMSVLQLYHND